MTGRLEWWLDSRVATIRLRRTQRQGRMCDLLPVPVIGRRRRRTRDTRSQHLRRRRIRPRPFPAVAGAVTLLEAAVAQRINRAA
jgi:hypothetical protein